MSISIGSVSLSEDLVWDNEFSSPVIGQSVNITIGGNTVIHTDAKQGGRIVVLSAKYRSNAIYGYFTRQQIIDIQEYERNGTVVSFVYGSQSFDVVVSAGGINVTPLLAKVGQGVDDYYTGTITLIEV